MGFPLLNNLKNLNPSGSDYFGGEKQGLGCSKLTLSLVNETLKFQMLISQIWQYFFMKKYEKLLLKLLSFLKKKISVYLVIKSRNT